MQLSPKKWLFAFLALPISCMAGTMGNVGSSKLWSIPLQGGFFGASQGRAQNIQIEGLEGNRYTVDNNNQISGLAGIGFYLNGYSHERFQLSYGVDLFYLGKTSVRGDIVQEHVFTNLSYKYDIQNLPLYAAAKALIYTNSPTYNITVDAGIGPNFMWTTNYEEKPLADYVIPDRAFKGRSATEFSVTAGVGLQLNHIIGPMPVECGYRFFYLGKGNLHKENDQYLNTLNTGDTYANALVCSITV
ncbi:MAG: hypothetical protein ACRCXC_01320 [Legionella sp.]